MVKKFLVFLFMFCLLAACSKSEPALVKKETPAETPNDGPELVEQKDNEQDVEFIEFSLPNEQVMINLKMVPILNQYLLAVHDKRQAIENMNLFRIHNKEMEDSIYLLEFSCQDDRCSYILLDPSKDNRAFLVADMAKNIQTKLSPDFTKVLLQFNRDTTLPIPVTDLVVMDLEKWESVPLLGENDEMSHLLNYTRPITTAEWLDEETITATVPKIAELTKDAIYEWQENGKPTNEEIYKLGTGDN